MDIAKELQKLGKQYSVLAVSPIDTLQSNINNTVRFFTRKGVPGVYVTFNKPYNGIKKILKSDRIKTEKILFIDCITTSIGVSKAEESVLHIRHPSDLTGLSIAISEFVAQIPGEKFLIIDALATLLIYNTEEMVIKFVRSVIEESSKKGLMTVVFSPSAKGDDLVNMVTLFFDKRVTLG